MHGTTLLIGGHGKTGRRVAQRLTARGVPVRIGSRSTEPAFDWEDETSWPAALDGVVAAYVTYHPDLAVPGAADRIRALAKLAVANGTRRLVLLSGRGEPGAQAAEEALQRSGAEWTILRCSWFSQNFSEGAFLDQVLSGEVALPVGSVKEPFLDADDIADAAATALTEDGHVGRLYELTGPRLMTFAEAVREVARASGRDLRFVQLSMDEYNALLAQLGLPADFLWLVDHLFTEVLDGRNACLADGVQRALGRAPRDFTDFARDAAAQGVWTPAQTAGSHPASGSGPL